MSAGAGLVFHGTGFYITDYGKDGKKDQKGLGATNHEHPHHRTSENHSGSGDTADSAPASASTNGKPHADSGGSNGTEPKPSADSSKESPKPVAKDSSKAAATAATPAKGSE